MSGAGVLAIACGLDPSGLADLDGGVGDHDDGGAGADAFDLPEACSSLDASACLGALPAGWQPVSVGSSCPAGYQAVPFVTDPSVPDGGCTCGACTVSGTYSCDASVPISGGNGCGDNPFANATPGQCSNVNQTQHLKAHLVKATGSVSCSAPNDAGSGAVATPTTVCVPGCDVDFCAGASLCAMADGHRACPPGLPRSLYVGTGADPGCAPCGCDASAPENCAGTVTAYYGNDCTPGDEAGTWPVDTCQYIQAKYKSVHVDLTAPPATCTVASATVEGDASLIGEKTVCCQ